MKVLSKLLGHADVNITYNIYIHLYGDGFEEMVEAQVENKNAEPEGSADIETNYDMFLKTGDVGYKN